MFELTSAESTSCFALGGEVGTTRGIICGSGAEGPTKIEASRKRWGRERTETGSCSAELEWLFDPLGSAGHPSVPLASGDSSCSKT